jgi:hypothetical protein
MGCPVVYYPPATTATGGGLLSRNYDFPTTSAAQIMGIPAPPDVLVRLPAAMSEPYVMQWYPSDGGYASLAVHAFDPSRARSTASAARAWWSASWPMRRRWPCWGRYWNRTSEPAGRSRCTSCR